MRGLIQEKNSGILARSLEERGIAVERVVIVGDRMPTLVGALRELIGSGADLVITSGGLGPTHDDLTMAAVAQALGRPMTLDAGALELVRGSRAWLRRIEGVSEETRRAVEEKQATLPEGARVLAPVGTAAGCVAEHEGGTVVCVLPGPPWELAAMWEEALTTTQVQALLDRAGRRERRVLRLFGVVESEFVQALGQIDERTRDEVEVGVCAKPAELEVSLRAESGGEAELEAVERALDAAFAGATYSRDGRTVNMVVADALVSRGQTLAVAESCTGGGLGATITALPGSSRWFLGGVIAYADAVKRDLLGVEPQIIERHGAVSAECAQALAAGARRVAGADWGLSITGVAGPDGGTAEKPVGLVYIGVAGPDGSADAHETSLRGDRARIRERSTLLALHRLRIAIMTRAASAT